MATLTTQEFANRVGCHLTTASRWQSGARLPGARYLWPISQAFGIPMKELQGAWDRARLEGLDKGSRLRPWNEPIYPSFARFLQERIFDRAAA